MFGDILGPSGDIPGPPGGRSLQNRLHQSEAAVPLEGRGHADRTIPNTGGGAAPLTGGPAHLPADWSARDLAGADWLRGGNLARFAPAGCAGGPVLGLFRRRRRRRDARRDGEGREPAGVRQGAGGVPEEVREAEGAGLGGHGEVGQAQGAGAVRRELVLHAGSLHGASPVPAWRGGRGLHGQGVRRPAAPRRPAQPLQPRLRRRGPARAAGAGGAQGGGEGPGRGPQADPAGAAGPGSHRRAGRRRQQEALREPINHFSLQNLSVFLRKNHPKLVKLGGKC